MFNITILVGTVQCKQGCDKNGVCICVEQCSQAAAVLLMVIILNGVMRRDSDYQGKLLIYDATVRSRILSHVAAGYIFCQCLATWKSARTLS